MASTVVVDEGRPDPVRRPISGRPPLPGRDPHSRSSPPVRWMDDGARLAITTWGSSSAPTVPTDAQVDDQRLTLTMALRNPGTEVVSLDLAAYVTVIETPSGLDPQVPATVVIGSQEYDLPPASEQQDEPYIELEPASPRPSVEEYLRE